jgi:hypothetical protein
MSLRLNSRAITLQAAVVSLSTDLEFAPLNGAVNPADGQLYVAGFQIWGSTAKRTSGLARVRYTGAPSTLHWSIIREKSIRSREALPIGEYPTPISRLIAEISMPARTSASATAIRA